MGQFEIQVVSTGQVRIRPQHRRANGTSMLWWLATSRRWTDPLPINVYVMRMGGEVILFDSGQDRRSVTDPGYFPRGLAGLAYRRLARFDIAPSDTLVERLATLGIRPEEVTTVVLSHLHQDHIGGIADFPNATLVVSRAEWQAALAPHGELSGFLRRHIDQPGLSWDRIEFAPLPDDSLAPFDTGYRLLDDERLTLLPLPGHTPGSLGLLVRPTDGDPLFLVGDLTYDIELLEHGEIPGVGPGSRVRATTRLVNELRRRLPGLVVLAAHDPGAADALREALNDRMGA